MQWAPVDLWLLGIRAVRPLASDENQTPDGTQGGNAYPDSVRLRAERLVARKTPAERPHTPLHVTHQISST